MKNKQQIQKMVVLAMLFALTIVLQAIARFLPAISVYALPLGLIPVAVAAIVYGPNEGILLGFLWGAFINISDPDCQIFYNWKSLNRFLAILYTIIAVAGRGALDGLFIGFVYKGLMFIFNLFNKDRNRAKQITFETIATIIVSLLMLLFNNLVFYTCLSLFFATGWPVLEKFFSINLAISVVVSVIAAPIMARIVLVSNMVLNTEKKNDKIEEVEETSNALFLIKE